MNLDRFTGPGSTPARRRFWDKVQAAVMASRKVAGRNVTIDEHSGAGSVINTPDRSRSTPTPPPFPCPPSNPCMLDFSVSVPGIGSWSTSQTGLDMYVGDCEYAPGTGWHANHWGTDCIDSGCPDHPDNSVCNDLSEACKCGWFGRWKDASGGQLQIKLAFVQGDDVLSPDGWWLLIGVGNTSLNCFWGGCQSAISYYGVFLGSDESIFATDLSLSMSLPADTFNPGLCSESDAAFDITFHPCA